MNMPFANVTAILQILPMTVTVAAAIVFKEKVGVFRISLIMLGFFGVILIINPAQEGFNMYAGYALISVLLITTRDLLSRKLSVDVPTLIPTVSASLGVLLFSILLITKTAFQPLDLQNSFFILAAAFFIIFGYYTAILVMRSGEISFISPFRYTAVLFALMLGFVFFDEQPDGIAFLGMTIVIISGIALMIRNNSVQKSI
jgi:S-adenosylmethionine uptake transporter